MEGMLQGGNSSDLHPTFICDRWYCHQPSFLFYSAFSALFLPFVLSIHSLLHYLPMLISTSTSTEPPARGGSSALFTPLKIANGKLQLTHRIILSPCTRNRGVPLAESTPEAPNRIWVPDALNAEYYGQRASEGGLVITEGIMPNPEGGAMPGVPGLWLEEQAKGWKLVRFLHFSGISTLDPI
jgi:hypothetical protein